MLKLFSFSIWGVSFSFLFVECDRYLVVDMAKSQLR